MSEMSAPRPRDNDDAPATESDIDDVLDKIDACLPIVHKRAKESQNSADTPTKGFSPENIKRTKMAFQAMSEEALLAASNDGGTPPVGNAKTPPPVSPPPGARIIPLLKPVLKRTMFFRGS